MLSWSLDKHFPRRCCRASLLAPTRQYYTDYAYAPVRSIAEASTTGHGTNIITGVAVGMKSTVIPCITVSVAVVAAYHLGRTSGVGAADGDGHSAGIFGTAVATVGLSRFFSIRVFSIAWKEKNLLLEIFARWMEVTIAISLGEIDTIPTNVFRGHRSIC